MLPRPLLTAQLLGRLLARLLASPSYMLLLLALQGSSVLLPRLLATPRAQAKSPV